MTPVPTSTGDLDCAKRVHLAADRVFVPTAGARSADEWVFEVFIAVPGRARSSRSPVRGRRCIARLTLRRVRLYADAGADGVFVPGLVEPADIAAVVAAVNVPLNVLFLPGQHTVASLTDLGVRRVSTGSLLFRAALAASVDTALAVRDGLVVRTDLPSYAEINRSSP